MPLLSSSCGRETTGGHGVTCEIQGCVWLIVSSWVLTRCEEALHPPVYMARGPVSCEIDRGRQVGQRDDKRPARAWGEEPVAPGRVVAALLPFHLKGVVPGGCPPPHLRLKWTLLRGRLQHRGRSPAFPLLGGVWNCSSTS